MINKVVKRIDKQGRLYLPKDLVKFSSIRGSEEIALCSIGKGELRLRGKDDVKNQKVIAILKPDSKGRIIIPSSVRRETQEFEIFVLNGDLIIKEAHE